MLIYCGASRNFISMDWVRCLRLKTKEDIKITKEFKTNSVKTTNQTFGMSIYLPFIRKSRFVQFNVLNNNTNMLILDLKFLIANEIVADFGKCELELKVKDMDSLALIFYLT